MKVKIVYPSSSKYSRLFVKIHNVTKIVFMVAALVCAIVNIAVGGKPWSLIVIWSLISLWNMVFSPDSFEMNAVRMIVKALFYVSVLLAIIDFGLDEKGWALFVIPILVFSTLIVSSVFFFIDIKEDVHNSMPVIWLIICSLVGAFVYVTVLQDYSWPIIVAGSIALGLLAVCIFFHKEFMLELKKRFHTQ